MRVYELENILSNVPDTAEVRFFIGDKQILLKEAEGGLVTEKGFLSDQPYHMDLVFDGPEEI